MDKSSNSNDSVDIAIIGGTGIYDNNLFSEEQVIKPHTPYGPTSDFIVVGKFNDKRIAFLPRHGKGHGIPPHMINCRANIWALKDLGVKRIIAPSAVGSLNYDYTPGDIMLPDQFIDFTKNVTNLKYGSYSHLRRLIDQTQSLKIFTMYYFCNIAT